MWVYNSRFPRIKNAKFSGYYFYLNTNLTVYHVLRPTLYFLPHYVIPAPLCNFFCSSLWHLSHFVFFLPHFAISEQPHYVIILPHFVIRIVIFKELFHFVVILLHFAIICRVNLGMFWYIFDSLAIFLRISNLVKKNVGRTK